MKTAACIIQSWSCHAAIRTPDLEIIQRASKLLATHVGIPDSCIIDRYLWQSMLHDRGRDFRDI